jgi:hypothetical protein
LFFGRRVARLWPKPEAVSAAAQRELQQSVPQCPPLVWTTLWATRRDAPANGVNAARESVCSIFRQEKSVPDQQFARL